jgi:hypothetical protein
MTDYSFLKTGFSTIIDNKEETCEDIVIRIQSILFSFMENGVKRAEEYVKHGNRNNITKEDLQLCLKAETFDFLNRPDVLDSVLKWRKIIEDDLEEEDLVISNEETMKLDVFCKNTCKCKCCDKLNNIDEIWNKWTPQDGIETILYNAIISHF